LAKNPPPLPPPPHPPPGPARTLLAPAVVVAADAKKKYSHRHPEKINRTKVQSYILPLISQFLLPLISFKKEIMFLTPPRYDLSQSKYSKKSSLKVMMN